MQQEQLRTEVRQFIESNFIFNKKKTLGDDESLIDSGVIDSTGVLELIAFLEQKFQVKFEDSELVAENFDSVNKIVMFIAKKSPGMAA
jgi:acyl carrier protein